MAEWISVTEQLPEKPGKYLVYGQWKGRSAEMWVCELMAIGMFIGWANGGSNPTVTHWRPLPKPPERGINE